MERKDRTTLIIGITLLVVASLILISLVYLLLTQEVVPKEEDSGIPIDDRISPLTNQGLALKILRIRHRGLLDKLMTPGRSWRNKPTFYFISDIDGLIVNSKDQICSGGSATLPFITWDSLGMEYRIQRDADEEQATSSITLQFIEQQATGLLGRKTKDVVRDTLHILYDYKTGHWYGDDTLQDHDGYGHHVGDTFEVWFDIQPMDYDHDGSPYWTEVNILGTDPRIDDTQNDPDQDGIPTPWEWKWGYSPTQWNDHDHLDPDIDGIENNEEYAMTEWFADPFHQDIYIEVDRMEKIGFSEHVCWEESRQAMIERFCQHNINLYFDYDWPGGPLHGGGDVITGYPVLDSDKGIATQYYNHFFPDERKGIFRYMIMAHEAGWNYPSTFNQPDTMGIGTSLEGFLTPWRVKRAYTPRLMRCSLTAYMMHETGHTLGINPWTIEGCDNVSYIYPKLPTKSHRDYKKTWGDYYSVMNYFHITDYNLIDYSDGSNGKPYDQNDWLHIYLPTFQTEQRIIEEHYFETPGKERAINETLELTYKDWNYSENLSSSYNGKSPVDPIECDFVILTNGSAIRLYAKPLVEETYAEFVLIQEGWVDVGETIHFDKK